MGVIRIVLWLGYSLLVCAGFLCVGALIGVTLLEFTEATQMAVLAGITALAGVVLVTGGFRVSARETTAEAILFLMLFWLVVPLVCATPFVAMGATDGVVAAIFESTSAITTTGASRLEPESLPRTLLFWRSLLQYFGGASTATFAVVILAALNLAGTGVHRSTLFTFQSGHLLERLKAIGGLIAAIYLSLAAFAFLLMVASGTPTFDALCLSLSGVGTGGLAPRSGPLANYLSPFSAVVLAVLCLAGALNVSVVWDAMRTRQGRMVVRLLTNFEHRGLLSLIAALIVVTVVFASLYNFGPAILDSVYFMSTAGFRYDVISLDMVPAPVLIVLALVGGSALSTAGGIKVIRLLLLFRHLGTDMARLSHPSRVVPIQLRRSRVEDSAFLSIWMYFFGYAVAFALGALSLAASGLDLQDALAVAAASLANIGPLLELTLPASGLRYSDFTTLQMIVSTLMMLLGRVEVLLALALILPSTWRQ